MAYEMISPDNHDTLSLSLLFLTSSLLDCFALLALNEVPASLTADSSFGRGIGMFEGLSDWEKVL